MRRRCPGDPTLRVPMPCSGGSVRRSHADGPRERQGVSESLARLHPTLSGANEALLRAREPSCEARMVVNGAGHSEGAMEANERVVESWGLTSHQRVIGDRVIAEESTKREHLVIYLSGAHAYG